GVSRCKSPSGSGRSRPGCATGSRARWSSGSWRWPRVSRGSPCWAGWSRARARGGGAPRCASPPPPPPLRARLPRAGAAAARAADLLVPALATGAVIVLRGALEYWRAMVAHETAARVQARLRARLYGHMVALGPAHVAQGRTGDVTLALVEAVQ